MTTARRTSLVRHLHLDIGYEQDVSPAVLAGAILEALEPAIIDEMGIRIIQAESTYTPGGGTITLYAPVDEVKGEGSTEAPPETPDGASEAVELLRTVLDEKSRPKVCPQCGKNGLPEEAAGYDDRVGFELCADCEPRPNVG